MAHPLDDILSPVPADTAEPAPIPRSAPPPELVMRELVLAPSSTQIPSWLTMALAVTLGLALVLAMGLWLQLREVQRLERELASMQQAVREAQQGQVLLLDRLQRIERELSAMRTSVNSLNADSPFFGDSFYDEPEAPAPAPGPGRTAGGVILPGGVWTGGF